MYGARETVPADTASTKNSTLATTASDMELEERRKNEEFCGTLEPDAGAVRLSTRTALTVTMTGAETVVLLDAALSVARAVSV